MSEMQEVWAELQRQRERQDAMKDELHEVKLRQAEGDAVSRQALENTQRILERIDKSDEAREVFRQRVEAKLEEVAETRGATAAAKWIAGTIIAILGLVTAWLGWGQHQ